MSKTITRYVCQECGRTSPKQMGRCPQCGAGYLFEMADTDANLSIFRLSAIDGGAMAATIRSLEKGSCDIERARNEVFSLSSAARELPVVLVMRDGSFSDLLPLPDEVHLPARSWRELSCDGSLIRELGLNQRS